jgi:hypothetical protein
MHQSVHTSKQRQITDADDDKMRSINGVSTGLVHRGSLSVSNIAKSTTKWGFLAKD